MSSRDSSEFGSVLNQFLRSWRQLKLCGRVFLFAMTLTPFVLFIGALFTPPPGSSALVCPAPIDCTHHVAAANLEFILSRGAKQQPAATDEQAAVGGGALSVLDELRAENAALQRRVEQLLREARDAATRCDQRVHASKAGVHELQDRLAHERGEHRSKTLPIIDALERSLANATALYHDALARCQSPPAAHSERHAATPRLCSVPVASVERAAAPGLLLDAAWRDRALATWQGSVGDVGATVSRVATGTQLRRLLGGRWLFIYGDSTSRVFFNTILELIGAPDEAQLRYGDVCAEFMQASDSRQMCRCRVREAEKDWLDAGKLACARAQRAHDKALESGLRVSFSWKEGMFDAKDEKVRPLAASPRSLIARLPQLFHQQQWLTHANHNDRRSRPDVLIVNSGFHALHQHSADEALVFRGERLTAALLLDYAAQVDAFVSAVQRRFVAAGGCVVWRATNSVSQETRLQRRLFAELNAYTVPRMLHAGFAVLNASASLTLDAPPAFASDDGLHYEKVAPLLVSLLAHALERVCGDDSKVPARRKHPHKHE